MTQQACVVSNLSLELAQNKLFTNLSFQLPIGQFTGLIGRNGQGKSLLMSILHGEKTTLPIQVKYLGYAHIKIFTSFNVSNQRLLLRHWK